MRAWSQREMETGLQLSIDDFVDEFLLVLESDVWELKHKQAIHGCLTALQESTLSLLERRVQKLQKKKQLEVFTRSPGIRVQCPHAQP